ncbi:MAG: type II 3-dehydroquinate dehydratase [Defluviitaleaceae bacterium]|nr:type II 3-dehydroquinate dehydratase [Defluviitaleaceae bacterium]
MDIRIINGPNLNFTGIRQVEIYGAQTLDEINAHISATAAGLGAQIKFYQSNCEGDLINYLQSCYFDGADGIIINPGALTHYSYALADALAAVNIPAIEVHLSNLATRDDFRQKSVVARVCRGQISGFGGYSYILALMAIIDILKSQEEEK